MSSETPLPLKPAVIIPAHNEATVIAATLTALLADYSGQFQVVVVCNGCTDNTADIVRADFPEVQCEVLEAASKALAIRHAEQLAVGFPRVYLDADIGINTDAIMALIKTATTPQKVIAVPTVSMAFDTVSAWVQRFYRVWLASPHVQAAGYGSGTYCLSQAARECFGEWPELIADDGLVRVVIGADAVKIVTAATALVKAPKTWWSLLKVKTRSKLGRLELQAYLASNTLAAADTATTTTVNTSKRTPAKSTLDWCCYLALNALALAWAYQRWLCGQQQWLRDRSNR